MSGPWDRAARFYDLQLGLERRALDVALSLVDPRPSDRLLDVAAGTGALLRRLAARTGAPEQVTGVDASAEMLARARGLPPHWQLLEADARRLPLADGAHDVVVASYLLHLLHPPDRAAALAECRRVIAPGGRLVIVTVTHSPPSLLGPAIGWVSARAGRRCAIIAGLRPFDPRPALRTAGFTVRRSVTTTRGYPSLVVLATPERTR